jgi:hypothetical protein
MNLKFGVHYLISFFLLSENINYFIAWSGGMGKFEMYVSLLQDKAKFTTSLNWGLIFLLSINHFSLNVFFIINTTTIIINISY